MIGARGAIATCVAYGVAGLARGWVEPTGLVTSIDPLRRLDLAGFDQFVLGGWDVCKRDLSTTVSGLVREGILSQDLVASASAEGTNFESRIRPGILDGPSVGGSDLDPESSRRGALSAREQIAELRADIEAFRDEHKLRRVVVVDLTSTEACWSSRSSRASTPSSAHWIVALACPRP